jgi:hypothetical protein
LRLHARADLNIIATEAGRNLCDQGDSVGMVSGHLKSAWQAVAFVSINTLFFNHLLGGQMAEKSPGRHASSA